METHIAENISKQLNCLGMNTTKTTHLSGVQRVLNYESNLRSHTTVWLCHYPVIKILKKDFYYLEVKMTAARDGKQAAIDIALEELNKFNIQANDWIANQKQEITNFDSSEFQVQIISSYGARFLKMIINFDKIMTSLAAAQFAGGQSTELRSNYLRGFISHVNKIMDICKQSELNFLLNGTPRNVNR